ncbi:hypothetical protein ZWY2020_026021 [Hordeum vulgare]|nr:hypothetical protein ZWY2020_026021 [Hordeum vulgare]
MHLAGQLLFRHRLQQRHREPVQQGRVPRWEEEAAEDYQRLSEPHRLQLHFMTEIGQMKLNHDAQVLAISSGKDRNETRLVHVPSFTVFQNWPGPRFGLQYPRCLDFSPDTPVEEC